jgi:hypothetical protein
MHTPGPWRVTPSHRYIGNGSAWRDILSDGTEFAPSYIGEALDKDAALIAAAPDLLAVLQFAVGRVELANAEGNPILSAWLSDARAAIARATGKD